MKNTVIRLNNYINEIALVVYARGQTCELASATRILVGSRRHSWDKNLTTLDLEEASSFKIGSELMRCGARELLLNHSSRVNGVRFAFGSRLRFVLTLSDGREIWLSTQMPNSGEIKQLQFLVKSSGLMVYNPALLATPDEQIPRKLAYNFTTGRMNPIHHEPSKDVQS